MRKSPFLSRLGTALPLERPGYLSKHQDPAKGTVPRDRDQDPRTTVMIHTRRRCV